MMKWLLSMRKQVRAPVFGLIPAAGLIGDYAQQEESKATEVVLNQMRLSASMNGNFFRVGAA